MTRMTGPDRAVMCNLMKNNTHTHTHTHTHTLVASEAGTLFDSHLPGKHKALILDIKNINPCVRSNLEKSARLAGKYLADTAKRKITGTRYQGSFPANNSSLPLALSTCVVEAGSDVRALIKELTTRRVKHSSEVHPDKSRYLAKGTE